MSRPYVILVVDDDREIVWILRQALAAPGFTILTAHDPYTAIRTLVERSVDLLITDIRMAELNGFELARQAKLMRPYLHVIYMSGYYSDPPERLRPIYGALLRKPFRIRELLREVERELGVEKPVGWASSSD